MSINCKSVPLPLKDFWRMGHLWLQHNYYVKCIPFVKAHGCAIKEWHCIASSSMLWLRLNEATSQDRPHLTSFVWWFAVDFDDVRWASILVRAAATIQNVCRCRKEPYGGLHNTPHTTFTWLEWLLCLTLRTVCFCDRTTVGIAWPDGSKGTVNSGASHEMFQPPGEGWYSRL